MNKRYLKYILAFILCFIILVSNIKTIDFYSMFVIILCTVFVLIADRIWEQYGKDDEVVETVEFYPPEGYNSAEIGFLYKGASDNDGVISLLLYLANKGYLKIEQEIDVISKEKIFVIKKIKEYDGDNECERMFMDGLFELRDYAIPRNLHNKFYITLEKIKKKLNSYEEKNEILESSNKDKIKWIIWMISAIFLLLILKPLYDEIGIGTIYIIIGVMLWCKVYSKKVVQLFKVSRKEVALFMGCMFVWLWLAIMISLVMIYSKYAIMYIVAIISIVVLVIFAFLMQKRTTYGNEMLGKVRGFKRFLDTLDITEKTKLESLVHENPEYFYYILPYAYALGMSNAWMKKFETIEMQAPSWYNCDTTFNMYEFNQFLNKTMKIVTKVVA